LKCYAALYSISHETLPCHASNCPKETVTRTRSTQIPTPQRIPKIAQPTRTAMSKVTRQLLFKRRLRDG
jgi:hypothetical protein